MAAPNTQAIKAYPSLFIAGLPEVADETSIMKHVEKIDNTIKLKNVQIRRDTLTLVSKCCGTIELYTMSDAERAINLLNYTELLGNEIRVMWYRPGGLRDKTSCNVFIKGLHESTKTKALHQFLSTYGKIFSCYVRYDTVGKCRGYGYAQFEAKEGAEKAMKQGSGKEFNGKKIEIEEFKPRDRRTDSSTNYNNLYVKCFPKSYTKEDLSKLFAPYGTIVSVMVKENAGFGFVCYKSAEEAKKAEEAMKGFKIAGDTLIVCKAQKKEERKILLKEERLRLYKDCNLYVKDFPEDTNDEKLKAGFSVFGEVVSARVMLEGRKNLDSDKVEYVSKGYGFVCFRTPQEAAKAVETSKTGMIMGKKLYVNIAQNKEERAYSQGRRWYGPSPHYMPPPPWPYLRGGMNFHRRTMMMHFGRPPARGPRMPFRGGRGMGRPYQRDPRFHGMMPPYPYSMPPYPPMAQIAEAEARPRPDAQLPADRDSLGEILYPLVEQKHPENSGKITGMLLEMGVEQVHTIIKDPIQLDKWIEEAVKVLSKDTSGKK